MYARLRLRIKGIQQVVESQSTSIASLTAERDCLIMGHQDESTGQGKYLLSHYTSIIIAYGIYQVVASSDKNSSKNFAQVIQGYITQIEELK